jgi:putative photosynthetic complex assembly protein
MSNSSPAFRKSDDEQLIPRVLLRGMVAVVLAALALTTYASVTDRPRVGQPPDAPISAERSVILQGGGARAVTVLRADGGVLVDLDHGGFVTVIENGLSYERRKNGVSMNLPVRLVAYENGRLAVHDPETGWSVELGSFGSDNKAAFERLMSMP